MRSVRHTDVEPLRATRSPIRYSNVKAPDNVDRTIYRIRRVFNPILKRVELQRWSLDQWFVIDATPALKFVDDWIGIFDLTGLGINAVIGGEVWSGVTNGAGTFRALNETDGGIRITTGATSGNDNTIANGDNNGLVYPWHVERDIWMHCHFRFPMIGDADHTYFLGAFWEDNDNYIGVRYDPDGVYFPGHSNMFLVTRADGNETVTGLGVPAIGTWYSILSRQNLSEVHVHVNDLAAARHTTNIPNGNLSYRVFLETQTNEAKRIDVAHLNIIQTHD